MLEQWEAGSEEPPHSHPGDDVTVVIEGRMSIQFFPRGSNGLVPDGDRIFLNQGETGYIRAGRIHDARYIEPCKLVYVHDKAFGFTAEG
jgi:quercetin dioxygenase-like cupin family protein